MTNRLKAVLVAAACLVCCLPLVVGIVGAGTGVAGAVGIRFQRYDVALLGLIVVIAVVVRDRRTRRREEVSSQ